jgi:hypothetical protein
LAIKNKKRVAGRICSGFEQNGSKRKRIIIWDNYGDSGWWFIIILRLCKKHQQRSDDINYDSYT